MLKFRLPDYVGRLHAVYRSNRTTLLHLAIDYSCRLAMNRHQNTGDSGNTPRPPHLLPPRHDEVPAPKPPDKDPDYRYYCNGLPTVAVPFAGSGGQGSGGRSRGPRRRCERSRSGGSGGFFCEGAVAPGGGRSRRLANRRQAAQGQHEGVPVVGRCGVRPSALLVFSAEKKS